MRVSSVVLGLLPLVVLFSAQHRVTVSADPACRTTVLADPAAEPAYSADFYAAQTVVSPNATICIAVAAYGPTGGKTSTGDPLPVGKPDISNVRMLDNAYRSYIHGGSWTVSSVLDGQPAAGPPGTSIRYVFDGTWTAPNDTGVYHLALTFTFPDGSIVEYFVNVAVSANASNQQLHSYIHDDVSLSGLAGQSIANGAYDILDPHSAAITHAHATFYFQTNPSRNAVNAVDGGMVDSQRARTVFDQNGPITIKMPHLGESAAFNYTQITSHGPMQQTGHISVAQVPPTRIGSQVFTYRADIDEPVEVRGADGRASMYVGSYVVDHGYSGVLGPGNVVINFGDARGFVFYVNPGKPAGTLDPKTGEYTVTWASVDHSAIDPATTRVTYTLTVCPRNPDAPNLCRTRPPIDDTGATSYSALVGPNDTSGYVTAHFTVSGPGGTISFPSDDILGDWPAAAPGPPPTNTPTPTTPPVPPTDTATPIPPTNTPLPTATPTVGPAEGTLSSVATPYAWISGPLLPAGTPDPILPTTHHSSDSTHFDWPAGVELRVLPALSEHPDEARLYLRDPNGAAALVYPDTIESITYTVTGGPCGTASLGGGGHYAHDGQAYPGEVAPVAGPTALPGAIDLAWLIGAPPGAGGDGAQTCSVNDYVQHAPGQVLPPSLPIDYVVTQRLHFRLVFHDNAAGTAASPTSCAIAPVLPSVAATPGPAFEGGDPEPFDGTQHACDAGDVRLQAVQQALEGGRIGHDASLEGITLLDNPADQPRVTHDMAAHTTTLSFAFDVTTSVRSLSYHLIMLHEVAP